ncbi:MAG: leucine--tRNA ligase [Chlorobiota bacterium]|nr:MAG: leucine--tRNA ligase [Chlorobiota bacterium]
MAYNFTEIEKKQQEFWSKNETFKTDVFDTSKPKYYVLDMFPYPSGEGLHVGHPEGFTATDIVARFKRHCGYNVLHPMGWDAFGLPTENYSMKTNIHPSVVTKNNTENFKRQLKSIGFSYDWSKEINTTTPEYYKWTQWIFLKLYNCWFDINENKGKDIKILTDQFELNGSNFISKPANFSKANWDFTAEQWMNFSELDQQNVLSNFRLVYEAMIPVNWCEGLGTVLANEEVDEWTGKGFTVERRPMRQWMMRITSYSERLLTGLVGLDWPSSTKDMQTNWIGKSIGAEVVFKTENGIEIKVFTTRPDTLFGVTFITVAPELSIVNAITTNEFKNQVDEYIKASSFKSERDRQSSIDKTGVFTGSYAIHPSTGKKIPIWTGDYVIGNYGTGAVMGVPSHDERDFIFAKKFNLPIIPVIIPDSNIENYNEIINGNQCYTGPGIIINSSEFDGLESSFAKEKMIEAIGESGKKTIQYKLRDWLFSRQRYWGEPIPLVHFENGIVKSLNENELPLLLPDIQDFKPSGTGESPLALAFDWLKVTDDKYGIGRRETNTMPQWAGSCWYYLRYIDPENENTFVNSDLEKNWLPIDLYIGGGEHAVLHLLYARFWHNVLFDLGFVSNSEPIKKLIHQGLILGEDSQKMSKSRGNVVNPDDIISKYGADALRLYEMFLGPLEMSKPWSTLGIEGVSRFLKRSWRMIMGDIDSNIISIIKDRELTNSESILLNKTIAKVTDDIENLRFNTAISALMIYVNEFINIDIKPLEAMEKFCILLSPFAPHISEEMYQRVCSIKSKSIDLEIKSIAFIEWPQFDSSKITQNEVEILLQINSKIKGKMLVQSGLDIEELEKLAFENEVFKKNIEGKSIKKIITVKDKIVNIIC